MVFANWSASFFRVFELPLIISTFFFYFPSRRLCVVSRPEVRIGEEIPWSLFFFFFFNESLCTLDPKKRSFQVRGFRKRWTCPYDVYIFVLETICFWLGWSSPWWMMFCCREVEARSFGVMSEASAPQASPVNESERGEREETFEEEPPDLGDGSGTGLHPNCWNPLRSNVWCSPKTQSHL